MLQFVLSVLKYFFRVQMRSCAKTGGGNMETLVSKLDCMDFPSVNGHSLMKSKSDPAGLFTILMQDKKL